VAKFVWVSWLWVIERAEGGKILVNMDICRNHENVEKKLMIRIGKNVQNGRCP